MRNFPLDFPVPLDDGGLGQGELLGGFGGDLEKNRSDHRASVVRAGKAPVILIHGNAGAADSGQWDMLDLKRMLLAGGYPQELIWAPSYLGSGGTLETGLPHIKNINDVRQFIENVCEYLNVQVVDIIAHSLGGTLAYAVFRGLTKKTAPPFDWNEPKKWHRVGTFVALASAFHGLSPWGDLEWQPKGEFMRELLSEQDGGGGETPYSKESFKADSPAHNIVYFCGIARGDFVDSQNPDTGQLAGAVNKIYNLGMSTTGHEAIKENQVVFNDFFPYLNSVPPVPPTIVTVDKDSGQYAAPVQITLQVEPADKTAEITACKVLKSIKDGALIEDISDKFERLLQNGENFELPQSGMWEVGIRVEGATELRKTYWIDLNAIETVICTDNSTPFKDSLTVMARASRGALYHSLNGQIWTKGATITIYEDSVVYFIAIDDDGIASAVVSRPYNIVPHAEMVTANVIEHFIDGRIDLFEFMSYSLQFGFFASFSLFLVDDDWVLNPNSPRRSVTPPEVEEAYIGRATLRLSARDRNDPCPKVHFTLDGSIPTSNSPFIMGAGEIALKDPGSKTLKYFAVNVDGRKSAIRVRNIEPVGNLPKIRVAAGYPKPGIYPHAVATVIEAIDPDNEPLEVFYSENGTKPGLNSPSFKGSREFQISGNGNHAICCCAADGTQQHFQVFHFTIDDHQYPETGIAPSRGGRYAAHVRVSLTPGESVQWTKYTVDGTVPDASNGQLYQESFQLRSNTLLKWRSMDLQGNLEPVNSAFFEVDPETAIAVFDNDYRKNGYIKSFPDGNCMIGSFSHLNIGTGNDLAENKAILHFDTACLPDNAQIVTARLQIECAQCTSEAINDANLVVDVKNGFFGTSLELQSDDGEDRATAEAIAGFDKPCIGTLVSQAFNSDGLNAINKTGPTQIRLRFDSKPNKACLLRIRPGAYAKLSVEYRI